MGSAPHFGAASFSQVAGVEMVHVPFKGGSPAVVSVVAGDTQLAFATPPSVLPMVKATLAREGTEVALSKSPEEFAAFLAEDAKFWVKLARDSGARAD